MSRCEEPFGVGIKEVSPTVAAARKLSAALNQADAWAAYQVLGDPIVRCAIQQALWQVVTDTSMALPLEQCENVLREAVYHLGTRAVRGPLNSGGVEIPRLGPKSYMPWIWSGDRSDVLGRSFRQVVEHEYGEVVVHA